MIHNQLEIEKKPNKQTYIQEDTCGVMDSIVGNGHSNQSSNLGWDCTSHYANTLGKVWIQLFVHQLWLIVEQIRLFI